MTHQTSVMCIHRPPLLQWSSRYQGSSNPQLHTQKRSLVKNHLFLPVLNFSSNNFLASCSSTNGQPQGVDEIVLFCEDMAAD